MTVQLFSNGDFALWTPASPAELLIDGGVEIWTSPTDLTNWSENLAGASTVNRDGSIKRSGSYAARFDVVAGALAQILQARNLAAATRYRFSAWGRTDGPENLLAFVRDATLDQYWRPNTQSWVFPGTTGISQSSPGVWGLWTQDFPSNGANIYGFYLVRNSAGGGDTYSGRWDDASLILIPTDCDDWTGVIAGGTSYISQSATEQRSDPYCVRFDIDAASNAASFSRLKTLTAGKTYRFAIYIKGAAGTESPFVEIQQSFGSEFYLQDAGSWAAASNNLYTPGGAISTSYAQAAFTFTPPVTGAYRFTFGGNTANDTIFFDDSSLDELARMTTLAVATEEIYQYFLASYTGIPAARITADNESFTPPEGETWGRLSIIETDSNQESQGGLGHRRFKRDGSVFFEISVPADSGTANINTLAEEARSILEGTKLAQNQIWLLDTTIRRVGVQGSWHKMIVQTRFTYTEIR